MRYYNHIDLHEIGEEEGRFIEQQEATYEPVYYCCVEKISLTSYHIFVDQPLFSNPVFEQAFRKAYRVSWVKSRTPHQLVIHLNQPCYFTQIVKLDLHRVFDEVMESMLCRSRIKAPVIPLKPPMSKAS